MYLNKSQTAYCVKKVTTAFNTILTKYMKLFVLLDLIKDLDFIQSLNVCVSLIFR